MSPTPSGRLVGTDTGRDLQLTRTFDAPIEDVWASITERDRTARWFGSWEGGGKPGAILRLTMTQEDGQPESDLTILACEPPQRLEVETKDAYGRWHLEARLAEDGAGTVLTFVHHLDPEENVGGTGPGWEYYLDSLVASVEADGDDFDRPDFDAYYPAMKGYYEGLAE